MQMIVHLRRWPLRFDIARRLAPIVRCRVDIKQPNPRVDVLKHFDRAADVVHGWYWKAGAWLTGSLVYFVILDDDKALLRIGRRTIQVGRNSVASWKYGYFFNSFAIVNNAGEKLKIRYLRSHEFRWVIMGFFADILDPDAFLFTEDSDPLCFLMAVVSENVGFCRWLSSLQPATGDYPDLVTHFGN